MAQSDATRSQQRFLRFVSEADAAVSALKARQLTQRGARIAELEGQNLALQNHVRHVEHVIHEITTSRAYRLSLRLRAIKVGVARLRFSWPRPRTSAAASEQDQPPLRTGGDHPLVSVVMPVYNKGRTLLESVRSVQSQTFVSWELLVWDDGSTDETTQGILETLAGPGIRVFRSDNQGVIGARNEAAGHARGRFLCFLDPDDLIQPTYLEKAVLFLESHPELALAYPWTRNFEGDEGVWPVPDLNPRIIAQQNQVPVCAVVRQEAFEAVGGFSDDMASGCEDWELWAHLAARGFAGRVIPEPLFNYRFSKTQGRDASARPLFDRHRQMIMNLHPQLGDDVQPAPVTWTSDVQARISGQPGYLPHGEGRPVLFLVPWLTAEGGAEAFLRSLAHHLVAQGRTVVFVCTHARPSGSEDGYEQMQRITPYVYNLPVMLPEHVWLSFCQQLAWRLHVPAVVNVGSTWGYEHVAQLRGAGRGPVPVFDVIFNHVGHLPTLLDHQDDVDTVVVVHDVLKELLEDHFNIRSRVEVVPVGVDLPETRAQLEPSTHSQPVFGWLGRFSAEKRPEWVLGLAAAVPEGHFRVAGTGPFLEEFRMRCAGRSNIEVLGFVEDGAAFVAGCDVMLNTSEIEGISVVAMEAIARGVPVVATDVGGMRDLISDAENGFLVDASTPQEMVEVVRRLVREPAGLAALRRGTREAGLAERFTASATSAAFDRLLG